MLGSAIVSSRAASLRQLEDAIVRQMLHGGHLTTHLLELGVSEKALARGLAEAHDSEPLPPGELPRASDTALQLVPRAIAERYRLYPLALEGGALRAVVAEPLPAAIENEIVEALGLPLRLQLAPLVRIVQALARDYEVPLSPEWAGILDALDALDESSTETPAPPVPSSSDPWSKDEEHAEADAAEPRAAVAYEPTPLQRAPMRTARRLGPVTPALAKEALENATTRDEVLSAFFDFGRQFFEYSALFLVQRAKVEGFDSHGRDGADRERVRNLSLSLETKGSLAEANARKAATIVSLQREGADRTLAEGLARQLEAPILLLPLVVRDRTVAILYGDHGDEALELAAVGDVLALAPLVGQALERLILRRKRAGKR